MDKKKIGDIFLIIISNLISIVTLTIIGFLIPKVLPVEQYAYYKLYTFYAGYATALHLGFIDGILIVFGKMSKEELEKSNFSSVFKIFICLQAIPMVIMLFLNLFIFNNLIMFFIILGFFLANVSVIVDVLYSVTLNFKRLSYLLIFEKIITILCILYLFTTGNSNFIYYVLVLFISYFIKISVALKFFKKVLFNNFKKWDFKLFKKIIRYGLPVMISFYAMLLAFGMDKIFLNLDDDIITFAEYSFAYSLILIIIKVLISANSVILPYVSRMGDEDKKNNYVILTKLSNILYTLAIFAIWVIPIVVYRYLPKYTNSIPMYYLLFSIILFQVHYNIRISAYYYSLKKSMSRLSVTLIVLIISIGLNSIVFLTSKSVENYSIMTIITFYIWVLLSDIIICKKLKVNLIKEYIYITLLIVMMYILGKNFTDLEIMIKIYIVIVSMLLIFYFKELLIIFKFVKEKIKKTS